MVSRMIAECQEFELTYKIQGLSPSLFQAYFAMDEANLREENIEVVLADDSKPGFPCRVSLADAHPGDRLLLINFQHLDCASPYRSSHAIFVSEGSHAAFNEKGEVPQIILERVLSIRAFDNKDMMLDADVVEGTKAEAYIEKAFSDKTVAYLHIHFAKRGCFAARVDRVS